MTTVVLSDGERRVEPGHDALAVARAAGAARRWLRGVMQAATPSLALRGHPRARQRPWQERRDAGAPAVGGTLGEPPAQHRRPRGAAVAIALCVMVLLAVAGGGPAAAATAPGASTTAWSGAGPTLASAPPTASGAVTATAVNAMAVPSSSGWLLSVVVALGAVG